MAVYMSVITTAELNTYTKKTLATGLAAQVVNGINAYIGSFTGRSFGETKTTTEVLDYAPSVYLRHMDVQSVTSVSVGYGANKRVADASTYQFNKNGRLSFFGPRQWWVPSFRHNDALEVVYTYGTTTVPDDLKLAALSLAADMYNYSNSGGKESKSVSVGSYSRTFASGDASSSGKRQLAVIASYKLRRF